MTKKLTVICLVLLGVIILGAGSCSQTLPANPAPNSSDTPPKPLPWAEAYGRFYTRDLARAQEEIPFPIILPSYVPDKRTDIALEFSMVKVFKLLSYQRLWVYYAWRKACLIYWKII